MEKDSRDIEVNKYEKLVDVGKQITVIQKWRVGKEKQ